MPRAFVKMPRSRPRRCRRTCFPPERKPTRGARWLGVWHSSLLLNGDGSTPEGLPMQLRARLTLLALFIAFAAAVVLVFTPVSASPPQSVITGGAAASCGSIALHTPAQAGRPECAGALALRSSLALKVAIASLALGVLDEVFLLAVRCRRKRRADAASTDASTRILGDLGRLMKLRADGSMSDLERLILLHETGAISDEHFAAHRAGLLIRG